MGELEAALGPARGVALFRQPVQALVHRPPVTCPRATRIADAARLMEAQGVGSVIVVDAHGAPEGIITDHDLRKVVAAGITSAEPVARIMSQPLHGVAPDVPAIEALLEMLRLGIRHLPLLAGSRLVGVVSTHDFLTLREAHPLSLLRDIERQDSLADLARLAPQTTAVVRVMLAEGVAAADLARVMARLNDALVRRVLALAEVALEAEGYDQPPAPYCWLALGSEGRREQTLRTDQDNALVYAPPTGIPTWACERYFARLAEKAVAGLVRCGFPPCPANIMATNPRWRQPIGVWRDYFTGWVRQSTPPDLLQAAIFFDFRAVWGDETLAGELAGHLREQVAGWRAFLRLLAGTAVETGPPLGAFGRLVTPWWGPHRGSVDLKLQGLLPLVSGLRVHALDLGLARTNTLERLQAAAAAGRFTAPQVEEWSAAYGVFVRLRLARQVADLDAGRQGNGRVALRSLNRAEGAALAEAFRATARLQDDLRSRYGTELLVG